MTVILRPEQEDLLRKAMTAGLAQTADEALDHAFDMLRHSLSQATFRAEATAGAARRLATFGKRNILSLGGMTVKQLLHESRT